MPVLASLWAVCQPGSALQAIKESYFQRPITPKASWFSGLFFWRGTVEVFYVPRIVNVRGAFLYFKGMFIKESRLWI
jgi:hypothetical protein